MTPIVEETPQTSRARKASAVKPEMEVVTAKQSLPYSPKVRSPQPLEMQPKRSPAAVEAGMPTSTSASSKSVPAQSPSAAMPPKTTVATPTNANSKQVNGHRSPEEDVPTDPFHRLQLQVTYNTASLESQKRGIEQIDSNVSLLRREMQRLFVDVDTLRAELRSRQANGPSGPQGSTTDLSELEMITTTISNVASKANEVDSLKMQLELLKRRMKRMEEAEPGSAVSALPPPPPISHQQQQQHLQQPHHHLHHQQQLQQQQQQQHQRRQSRQPMPEPMSSGASASMYRRSPAEPSVLASHGRPMASKSSSPHQSAQPLPHHPSSRVSETSRPLERELSSGGWTSVNTGSKRNLPTGVESAGKERTDPLGSPKRPKLTPLEPRKSYDPASASSRSYEPMDTEESELTRRSSYESYHVQGSNNQQGYTSYPSTNEQDPDDSWRPESQRHQVLSRGAQASTYNRGRRSVGPSSMELGTPEWERSDWSGPPPHMLQDGYYQLNTSASVGRPGRGSVIRRGGGGGGAMMVGYGQRSDPFAHTKKTRTKPIRNSDGVLIRKDGQPDMRSHSSAANLRKVHLRKDGEWSGIGSAGTEGGTPQSGSLANSVASHDENYTMASPHGQEIDSDEVEDYGTGAEQQLQQQQREYDRQGMQQRQQRSKELMGRETAESESPSASAVATAAMLAGEETPPSATRRDTNKTSSVVRGDSKIDYDDAAAAVSSIASPATDRRRSSKSHQAASASFAAAADAAEEQLQQQHQQQKGTGARHQAIMSKVFPRGLDENGERERGRLGHGGEPGSNSKDDDDEEHGNDHGGRKARPEPIQAQAPQAVMMSERKTRRKSAADAAAAVAGDKGDGDVDMRDDPEETSIAETQR